MKLLTLIFSLFIVTVFSANAQRIQYTTHTYQGNTITIETEVDTMIVVDPETGKESMVMSKREKLDRLNGNTIYFSGDASEPVGGASQKDVQSFIRNILGDELHKINDVNELDFIIDEKGNVGYIHIRPYKYDSSTADKIAAIRTKLAKMLKDVHFLPAQKDGKAVPYAVRISK